MEKDPARPLGPSRTPQGGWEWTERTRGEHPKNSRGHRAAYSRYCSRAVLCVVSTCGKVLQRQHLQGTLKALLGLLPHNPNSPLALHTTTTSHGGAASEIAEIAFPELLHGLFGILKSAPERVVVEEITRAARAMVEAPGSQKIHDLARQISSDSQARILS